jgi:hypothetical protein
MADEAQHYGLRARTAQLLTWLFGQQQQTQQQQTQKADRQVFDGYDRGNDDPDNRRAVQQVQPSPQAPLAQERTQAQQPGTDQDALRAALEAAQRRFEAQQRQRQQGRGRGW